MSLTQALRISFPAVRRASGILCLLLYACGAAQAGGAAPPALDAPHAPLTEASGPRLPWLGAGRAPAREALHLLRNAPADGLDPADYGTDDLARRLDGPMDSVSAAAYERDLGKAMLRFLSDLHGGRLAPDYRPPAGYADRFDAQAVLADAFRESRLQHAVDAAAPALPLYRRVKQTLRQYRDLALVYPQWPPLPSISGRGIAAGSAYEGAALLRERLQLLGDLDADADVPTGTDHVYTDELAAAVRRFQARHGLAEDGVLGPGTIAALSVPLTRRVAQLELTLERLRWLPPLPRGRIVAVNLPAYRLWAFDTSRAPAEPVHEMRVIVGTAMKTPTPVFIGQMRYLEINPYWNVPRSIETAEIIPKLARNPAYLRQNDMELVSQAGEVLPETQAAFADLRAGRVRVRQRPGASNALGAVKFAMPNPMNIYLHSTSAQELFDRTRRDLSHGCIRVEHPEELAQFVLADPSRWNAGALDAAIRSGETRTVTLPATVPVVLFYATAVTDRNGQALFAEDVYRRDDALIRQLHAH